jgi:methionyl-tRNA formyltransferase
LTQGVDEGPLVATTPLRIDAEETAGSLFARAAAAGAELLVETLAQIEAGTATETPQSSDGVTYARKITPTEARIDWSRPALEIDRLIRGLSPFPGAWFTAGGVRIKALLSRAEDASGPPGQILDDNLLIACGTGAVRLLKAQREGKGAQNASDFLRGFPLIPGQQVT